MKTVLAPLTLSGIGSPLVESFSSYFIRMAFTHQVTVSQLGRAVCNDAPYLQHGDGPKLIYRAIYPAMLCSYSRQTAVLVRRLEQLTGQRNLRCGTLLNLEYNLCDNQTGAIVEMRRWCPLCYLNIADNFAEPLAWCVPVITRCPLHDVALENRCAFCNIQQRAWRDGVDRALCWKCHHPLASHEVRADETTPWVRWCQQEMLKILDHNSQPEATGFVPDAFRKFAAALPPPIRGLRVRRDQQRVVDLRQVVLKYPDWRPRLKTIFQIAAIWGTTPLDVLLRPLEAASPNLFDDEVSIPTPPRKRAFKKENYRKCEQRFRALLKLPPQVLLPPAEHLCVEHQVSTSHFQLTRREVWDAYIREKDRRFKEAAESRVRFVFGYMEKLIERMEHSGVRLHRRNAIAQVVLETGAQKRVVRSALRFSLMRLQLKRRGEI